jgi:hypothetical protein
VKVFKQKEGDYERAVNNLKSTVKPRDVKRTHRKFKRVCFELEDADEDEDVNEDLTDEEIVDAKTS